MVLVLKKLTIVLLIMSLLVVFVGCPDNESGGRKRKPIKLGQSETPDFTAKTIKGETITLSDYIGKKAVIVDLWATWCPPCQAEMPILQSLYDKYSDKLEIIAVSQDGPGDQPKIEKFVRDKNITFKIVHDISRDISRKFPSTAIPFLTLIGKDGKIIKTFRGFKPGIASEIEQALNLSDESK